MAKSLLIFSGFCFIALTFYLFSQDKAVQLKRASNPVIEKEHYHPETKSKFFPKVTENLISAHPTQYEEVSDVDSDRDYLLWRKESDEIEEAWNKEIYTHIQYINREHADELYNLYLKERREYLIPQEVSLEDSLNELSRMNGESIENERDRIEPEMEQDRFISKLRGLFRQDYKYIEAQRKIFLDSQLVSN
ncbi:hypothetical protein [Peredibacter starrii]|uniref:Lipase modulator n=1 Tax=Peredibacter starrii TaxID=28202 RepID=A0AAX4HPA6_9BACT|nr:hypothetical protein [Peredibacter starrii]WPU65143.1 hypothetical protein SOO65_00070 [Peredibacter starrii]